MPSGQESEFELDPEIERTFRQRRRTLLNQRQNTTDQPMANPNPNVNAPAPEQRNAAGPEAAQPMNPIMMADDRNRAIRDYADPQFMDMRPSIVLPEINFEIKSIMIQQITAAGQYRGVPGEDPHGHLRTFLDICRGFTRPGMSVDGIKLLLFPYSLADHAKAWLNSLGAGSITTWAQLADRFLAKYFPPTVNAKYRKDIMSFEQEEGETMSSAWERFKALLRRCPHHGLPTSVQMEAFYGGLHRSSQMVVDASASGAIMQKTFDEAVEILDRIARNNSEWTHDNTFSRKIAAPKTAGMIETDQLTALTAKLDAMNVAIKNLSNKDNAVSVCHVAQVDQMPEFCRQCGDYHGPEFCPQNVESVNFVGRNQTANYGNSYNPNWRNHPNFSYANNNPVPFFPVQQNTQAQNHNAHRNNLPMQASQPFQKTNQASTSNSLEDLMRTYITKTDAVIQAQSSSIRNLETQLGQLATELRNRPPGSLPSNTEGPMDKAKER